MNPGELKRRVTFQKKVSGKEADGTPTEQWPDIGTFWAAVEPLAGREFVQAGAVSSEVTCRIRVRYTNKIDSSMRGIFKGRIFEITAVINVNEANRELHLMCKEVGTVEN